MPGIVWGAAGAVAVAIALLVLTLSGRRTTVSATRLQVGAPAGPATRSSGTAEETVALAKRVLVRIDERGRLAAAIEAAGVGLAAADLLVIMAVGALTGALLGGVLGGPLLAVLLAAAAPAGAAGWLSRRADRRRQAFAEQLDDALQLMASSLRAGHSILRAIDAVSRDTRAPMSDEFARVVNEVRVGRDLNDALTGVADRTRSEDLRWVVQAIAVHREVGGNLAEVLDRVGETLRERAQLFRQARALSAEGRTSGLVLLLMPFAVAAILCVAAPDYLAPLVTTSTGLAMLLVALGMMLAGALWLRSIVKVRF